MKHESEIDYPITNLDLSEYIDRELVQVGEADLQYWTLLGGKRVKRNGNDNDNDKARRIAAAYQKQENDWKAFIQQQQQQHMVLCIENTLITRNDRLQKSAVLVRNMIFTV